MEKVLILKEKLTKAETKKEEVIKRFTKIPASIIRDFEIFPQMTEEALRTRYSYIYRGEGEISKEELIEAYKEYFNK